MLNTKTHLAQEINVPKISCECVSAQIGGQEIRNEAEICSGTMVSFSSCSSGIWENAGFEAFLGADLSCAVGRIGTYTIIATPISGTASAVITSYTTFSLPYLAVTPAPVVTMNFPQSGCYSISFRWSIIKNCDPQEVAVLPYNCREDFNIFDVRSICVGSSTAASNPVLVRETANPICAGSEVCFFTDYDENGIFQFSSGGPYYNFVTQFNGARQLVNFNAPIQVIPLSLVSYTHTGKAIVRLCYSYLTPGTNRATKSNSGICGGTPQSRFIDVEILQNKVSFTTLPDCNGNVTLMPSVQCATTNPTVYNWNFGDGTTGTSYSNVNNGIITHQYSSSFTGVIISLTANGGQTVSRSIAVTQPPVLELQATYSDPTRACSPIEQYSLTGLPAGCTASWFVQGGNITVNSQTTASVTWTATRQDVDGNSAMGSYLAGGTITVTVSNGECSYPFTFNVSECCATNSINFTNLNSVSGVIKATDVFIGNVITSKKYYVDGRLIIDKNMTFTNCWLKMGPYAEIIVTGGNKLTTKLTTITAGCSVMWQHIYVDTGAQLELNNRTHIEDGITAVYIAENAMYTINQTVFNKNYDAMLIDGSPTAGSTVKGSVFAFAGANITNSYTTITDVFVNNLSFSGTGLRYPHQNDRSNNGIFVQFCKEITQFGEPSNGSQNLTDRKTFYQLKYGVNARMSNIHIYNNDFLNFFNNETKENEIAINVLGNTKDAKTSYSILIGGTTTNHANYFNFCEAGVVTYHNINSSIRNNKFSKVERGLSISNNINNNNVTVYKNNFDNCGFGVLCHYNTFSNTTIHFNTMQFTDAVGSMNFGISVNDQQSKTGVYTIANNNIESALNGIMVNTTLGAKANNNTIKLAYDYYLNKRVEPKTSGIVFTNSPKTEASCNSISCFTTPVVATELIIKNNTNSKGIEVFSSNTLNIDNNSANIIGAGIEFNLNCDGTKAFKNDFNKVNGGIILQNNAIIGPQGNNTAATSALRIANDNAWQGGPSNSTYRLYDGGGNATGILANSPFFYRTTAPKYDLDNSHNFGVFTVATTTTNRSDLPCGHILAAGFGREKSIHAKEKLAKGEINFGVNDAEKKWMGKADVFDMMLNDDSLGLASTVLANFKDSADYSNIAKLRHARNTNNDTLHNKNAIAAALAINNSIAPNNNAEEVYKQINAVVAQSLLNDTIFVTSQLDSLRAIAALCPYTDGLGVYEARALLVFYDTLGTNYNNACELPQLANNRMAYSDLTNNINNNSSSEQSELFDKQKQIGISPNPSTGALLVEVLTQDNSKLLNIRLLDVFGREVRNYEVTNTNETRIQIEETGLSKGLYFVQSNFSSGEQITTKWLIVEE